MAKEPQAPIVIPRKPMADKRWDQITDMIPHLANRSMRARDPSALAVELYSECQRLRKENAKLEKERGQLRMFQ